MQTSESLAREDSRASENWIKKRADEKELMNLVLKVIEKYEKGGVIELRVASKEQGEFFVKAIEVIFKAKLRTKIVGKKKNWKVIWEKGINQNENLQRL